MAGPASRTGRVPRTPPVGPGVWVYGPGGTVPFPRGSIALFFGTAHPAAAVPALGMPASCVIARFHTLQRRHRRRLPLAPSRCQVAVRSLSGERRKAAAARGFLRKVPRRGWKVDVLGIFGTSTDFRTQWLLSFTAPLGLDMQSNVTDCSKSDACKNSQDEYFAQAMEAVADSLTAGITEATVMVRTQAFIYYKESSQNKEDFGAEVGPMPTLQYSRPCCANYTRSTFRAARRMSR
eukprot:NODE_5085_length_1810_cov_4.601307.p1 GENE.NODE_5085_length_1810_cov_4.601307~~NODE_5085_length_1810_cov_4.601307.p1  ORF type:complete len:236 (-),score=33.84 NODE_5085_length_1810_cov_4.601307:1067-1774(-)